MKLLESSSDKQVTRLRQAENFTSDEARMIRNGVLSLNARHRARAQIMVRNVLDFNAQALMPMANGSHSINHLFPL
ncbi:uncharacterized protein LAESUDRAFT_724495 [Laetiporus sulphureus 93-53]|uniref:Uncharacterized protein n=1 Tax=Laetiporus sulphureus 93-53 TaxID=1314785 RepID=A0A165EZ43_9APHY|nr:uncharacterized protein LAESUDRAFT_724495 [Laetiporus sulphureus 93-53]KZT08020.1 hypothetical protein LAESUDRAFT_724495 [Laetiporus sulphureus 93-53]